MMHSDGRRSCAIKQDKPAGPPRHRHAKLITVFVFLLNRENIDTRFLQTADRFCKGSIQTSILNIKSAFSKFDYEQTSQSSLSIRIGGNLREVFSRALEN